MCPSSETASGATDLEPVPVDTPTGPARYTLSEPDLGEPDGAPCGLLVLGHGAGGGITAPDLVLATRTAQGAGWRVARVEQPWRVAGKRVAVAPPKLDLAWLAVLEHLHTLHPSGTPLLVGGRSAGARVACRTALETGATGVLALAFPLHPPGRPDRSRVAELAGAGVPALVVQGERDPFGGPGEVRTALAGAPGVAASVEVVGVAGDHSLKVDRVAIRTAIHEWLDSGPKSRSA